MMKKIWFLYPDTTPLSSNAFDWFRESFSRYGMEVEVHFWDEASPDTPLSVDGRPDAVVMRGYNLELSRKFESGGIRVLNTTRSMELCRDKIATSEILAARGIPTPRTVVYEEQYPTWERLVEDFGGKPVIMKLSFGSKGEDVFLVEERAQYTQARRHCEKLAPTRPGSRPLYQEYIQTSCGRDIRVWVIGGKVAGCTLRSNKGSFKSNFAQGGNAHAITLPQGAAELAVRAVEALGLEFAGVDILFGGGEYPEFLVCEVNGNAGFRTASLIGGVDIPTILAEYMSYSLCQHKFHF